MAGLLWVGSIICPREGRLPDIAGEDTKLSDGGNKSHTNNLLKSGAGLRSLCVINGPSQEPYRIGLTAFTPLLCVCYLVTVCVCVDSIMKLRSF